MRRREMLQAGAAGILGIGMNHLGLLPAMAAPGFAPPAPRAKSVIYIFLSGGLAQHESFDMKPDAPMEVRGEFKPIRTRTPGTHICEHLPRLARLSEKWSLVRSLTHGSNDHSAGHHIMLTGRSDLPAGFDPGKPKKSDHPGMAALATALLPKRPDNLPPAIVLPDKIVHRTGRTLAGQFAGTLGAQHDPWFLEMSPYHPGTYGAFPGYLFSHDKGLEQKDDLLFRAPHLSLPRGLTLDRLMDRVSLRDSLEKQTENLASLAGDGGFDHNRDAALSLLGNRRVHDAFSLDKVDPKWLDRYGRHSFGWSLLMARRLVESGVRMVQVNLGNNESWDTHQAAWRSLGSYLLPPMDQAVSALIEDLDSSGLLDDTLIVMGSEFGRTPKISLISGASLPGRDHWGAVQTVLLAGGGVRGGRVIGSSDKVGGHPASDPQTPENLAATIYEALGLPREILWHDFNSRPHPLFQAEPIPGLV
jgi:hypothetical protein